MSDFFALLAEPHRPWLDQDLLKKKFLNLSAEVHPDRVHSAGEVEKRSAEHRYAELNEAYNHLRRHKERLQHLLELETGVKPAQVQQIPADLTEFFVDVGQLFKGTDAFLAEKAKTTSPLLQVRLFEAGQALTGKLKDLQHQLNSRQKELVAELQAIDARWAGPGKPDPVSRATMLRRLEQLYRLFSYFARWEEQIQERIVQLAM
jgi:DnaJ-domain-containing protein 1